MYELRWSVDIWTDDDKGENFETYGSLTIDIGQRPENQGKFLWIVSKRYFLSVPLGTSKVISSTLGFQECKSFRRTRALTLHGKVVETEFSYVGLEDRDMGDFEGKVYSTEMLLNGLSVAYYRSRRRIVTINMTLTAQQ